VQMLGELGLFALVCKILGSRPAACVEPGSLLEDLW
jgi:hypothetical protein